MSEPDFFFNTAPSVSRIEGIELSHPAFSRTYYLVRNPNPWRPTQWLRHSKEEAPVEYQYCPLAIRPAAARGDLDYGVSITVGDVGEILPEELDRVLTSSLARERPVLVYRAWRSDRLWAPMDGPVRLQVDQISRAQEGSTFDAVAPYLNMTKTGEVYSLGRFEGLRGFL